MFRFYFCIERRRKEFKEILKDSKRNKTNQINRNKIWIDKRNKKWYNISSNKWTKKNK